MMSRKWILLTSKRRLYMLLKLFIIVIMFGLYIFFLMQESMSVIEKNKHTFNNHKDIQQQRGHGQRQRYVRIGKVPATVSPNCFSATLSGKNCTLLQSTLLNFNAFQQPSSGDWYYFKTAKNTLTPSSYIDLLEEKAIMKLN